MNIYTFLDSDCNIIIEVRAGNHDEAIIQAQTTNPEVNFKTDYSVSKIEE